MHKLSPEVDIEAIMQKDDVLVAALNAGVRDALLDHKRTGAPIVVWQDGKVVWIPADQIVIDEPPQA